MGSTLTSRTMQRVAIPKGGLESLASFFRGVVRSLQGLAVAAVVGVAAIAAALARDGLEAADVFVTLVLLAAPAVLLFFAAGLRQVLQVPGRVRRMPGEGSEQLAELTRIAEPPEAAAFAARRGSCGGFVGSSDPVATSSASPCRSRSSHLDFSAWRRSPRRSACS